MRRTPCLQSLHATNALPVEELAMTLALARCLRRSATLGAGCPSFGGQRTVGCRSTTTLSGQALRRAVLRRRWPSRENAHALGFGSLVSRVVATVLPNPAYERTANGKPLSAAQGQR
jgi:hypothetical protein